MNNNLAHVYKLITYLEKKLNLSGGFNFVQVFNRHCIGRIPRQI